MRLTLFAALLGLSVPFAAPVHADTMPAYIAAALNAPARKDDAANDARRKPADVTAFADVKPGEKILELAPGEGYWTRIFSGIVGANGHVYALWPNEMGKYDAKAIATWQGLVSKPPYNNVSVLQQPGADLSVPEPVDVVFTSQNYHDYHDKFMGPVDMASFNKKVYSALKPGGLYVIVDHVAPAGSGFGDTETLHRVDPEAVKKEVEAAGFSFDGASDALKNPADPHDKKVFDSSIRGHTDQFIFRFKKPAH